MDNSIGKISFAISMSPTNFEAVGQGDWRKMIRLVSSLGYNGVELAIRNPESINISQLQSILKKYQLKLAAIGTGQAYLHEKLSLSDDGESIRLKATERLKKHIDLANILGGHILIGLIKGDLGKNTNERSLRFSYFKNSILEVADYAYKKNISILIEPLNRYECDFFNRLDEVLSFIRDVNRPSLGVLLDTFHMNIEEKDIYEVIIESGSFLKHIHIADSNRWYPGEGHLDFQKIINTLKGINYDGFISGEILPLPDLETAMRNYIKRIREILNGRF